MRLTRVTRCALLLVPLLVCAGRLHAQRSAVPAGLLQEVNRCLAVVRSTSKRRTQHERNQRLEQALEGVRSDQGRTYVAPQSQRDQARAS
jgi:hypothetical protein